MKKIAFITTHLVMLFGCAKQQSTPPSSFQITNSDGKSQTFTVSNSVSYFGEVTSGGNTICQMGVIASTNVYFAAPGLICKGQTFDSTSYFTQSFSIHFNDSVFYAKSITINQNIASTKPANGTFSLVVLLAAPIYLPGGGNRSGGPSLNRIVSITGNLINLPSLN